MGIPTYTPGYPPDGSSLGQTKSTIRNNLDGTFLTLAVDHVNNNGQPNMQPAGYHTIIHTVPQASVATVNGYTQVFSGVPGTLIVDGVTTPNIPGGGDTQLYSLSGIGVLSQLTGNNLSANGFCWVGGILIQWGNFNPNSSTSVTFPVAFPTAVFNIQLTGSASNNSTFRNGVATGSLTTAGFNWQGTIDSHWTPIYWMAIGN